MLHSGMFERLDHYSVGFDLPYQTLDMPLRLTFKPAQKPNAVEDSFCAQMHGGVAARTRRLPLKLNATPMSGASSGGLISAFVITSINDLTRDNIHATLASRSTR